MNWKQEPEDREAFEESEDEDQLLHVDSSSEALKGDTGSAEAGKAAEPVEMERIGDTDVAHVWLSEKSNHPSADSETSAVHTPADSRSQQIEPELDSEHEVVGVVMNQGSTATSDAEARAKPESDEHLEELQLTALAPSDPNELVVGEVVTWGEHQIEVLEAMPHGWYTGVLSGRSVLLRPGESHYSDQFSHQLLAPLVIASPDGVAVAQLAGHPVEVGNDLRLALLVIQAVAKLVRFLEAKGLAVLEIDAESLIEAESEYRLQIPPRVVPIGSSTPPFYRERVSPPELQDRVAASGKEGVYVLATILYRYLTGNLPPVEGVGHMELSSLGQPGLPQLLSSCLDAEPSKRPSPQAVLVALRRLLEEVDAAPAMNALPCYQIGAATTIGLNPDRHVNEDSYGFTSTQFESSDGKRVLLRACVADGMGGGEAGEVASQAAVRTFCGYESTQSNGDQAEQAERTIDLGWRANAAVLEALGGRDGGCTLTAVTIEGDSLCLAHVGDSRAYLYGAEGLRRLSSDHSLVSAMVSSGEMTEAEARVSQDRSTILRSLGSIKSPQRNYIDSLAALMPSKSLNLTRGDVLILCSDGIHGELEDGQIGTIVRGARTPNETAVELVSAAISAGAPDNATAVVIMRS